MMYLDFPTERENPQSDYDLGWNACARATQAAAKSKEKEKYRQKSILDDIERLMKELRNEL